MNKHIAFISGDTRQIYLANLFSKHGYKTYTYGLDSNLLSDKCISCSTLKDAIIYSDSIVFPFRIDCISFSELEDIIPFLKHKIVFGGCISEQLKLMFNNHNITFFDYFKENYINTLNAIATAEGCIYYAINNSDINLHGSNALVIGYGTCGSILANKLDALNCQVTVTTRNTISKAKAITNNLNTISYDELPSKIHNFPFIFNTVPALIINESILNQVDKDCIIIDIASSPL